MRILYFTRTWTVHDQRFLTKLAESRHEVWFLPLEPVDARKTGFALPPGIRAVDVMSRRRSPSNPQDLIGLMEWLESALLEVQPDLVHAGPVQSCGFMTALSGFHPFLCMSWGSDILLDADRDEAMRWVTAYTLKHADMLLYDCRAVGDKAAQFAAHPDHWGVELPWGVDLGAFSPSPTPSGLRQRFGRQDCFVVLSTRSWEPIYGIETLIWAFGKAYAHDSRLRLILTGQGSLAAVIEERLRREIPEHAVFRPGMVTPEALPEYFRAADLYVSCSQSDGTSVSLLEAMATGLPVVVGDLPSNREWVTEGVNGWLIRPGHDEGLAQAILTAADLSPQDLAAMGRSNRAVAESRADWHSNFGRLLDAYERLQRRSVTGP